jgi:uncharacterized membrane protein
VARGVALAEVGYEDGSLPAEERLGTAINELFEVGDNRVSDQDVEYHIDQLVEVAVRSLSPAINDPFTAMACVDRLGASLRYLVRRELPSPYHRDDNGTLRIISKTETFEGALDAAFNLIRQYGRSSAPVSLRLIETLAVIAEHTTDPVETQAIRNHLRMIEHAARSEMQAQGDREALQERYEKAVKAIEAPDDEAI